MRDPVLHFGRRVLSRQALVGVGAFVVVGIFAPRLLMLEGDVASGVLSVGATLAALAITGNAAFALVSLHRQRRLLRAIAGGGGGVDPTALARLADLPSRISIWFFTFSSLVSALVFIPGVRPDKLDDGRAVSLFTLALTILGGASLPLYVLTRLATIAVIELAPLEPLISLLEAMEIRRLPWRRISRRLLLAGVAPVALLGAGAVLVTHAHLRTFVEQSRRTTAIYIARSALEPSPTPSGAAGRSRAAAAAADLGFIVHLDPQAIPEREPVFSRDPDGQLVVTTPLDEGQATIRFSAELDPATVSGGVAVGVMAVLFAGVLGALFGRVLADDLAHATRRVRILGTETVLRGSTQIARPARYAMVSELGRAIEELTARFRVFAAAQERALDARAAAQRMRGLLFASVSHDLKSPLNAILGFAELVGQGQLTNAQRESLSLISKRGRELLGLIETILDAARVEAGQLNLSARPMKVDRLVTEAVRKARELAGGADVPVIVEVSDELPTIPGDPAYATRALAVIVAQAIRTAAADPSARITTVRATLPARPGDKVCVDVELGSRDVTRDELELLFARQATGRGRGLTLGLSLARSVIELHGGSVDIEGMPDGGAVCHAWFPLVAPRGRPQLSSFPTLG
ncbi:multi-sensor hybrid histidine kinase [Minicystis rosea]|nr:multi-sensor hybrid histidine kinase [Minicystis rosea]